MLTNPYHDDTSFSLYQRLPRMGQDRQLLWAGNNWPLSPERAQRSYPFMGGGCSRYSPFPPLAQTDTTHVHAPGKAVWPVSLHHEWCSQGELSPWMLFSHHNQWLMAATVCIGVGDGFGEEALRHHWRGSLHLSQPWESASPSGILWHFVLHILLLEG